MKHNYLIKALLFVSVQNVDAGPSVDLHWFVPKGMFIILTSFS